MNRSSAWTGRGPRGRFWQTLRRGGLAGLAVASFGCAATQPDLPDSLVGPPGLGAEGEPPGIEMLPIGAREVVAADGSHRLPLETVAARLDTKSGPFEGAQIAVILMPGGLGLTTFTHADSAVTIDDLVYQRRLMVREAGILDFVVEERFFRPSSLYRAASLSLFRQSGEKADGGYVAYSLVADSARGKIEVFAWSEAGDAQEDLRELVMDVEFLEEER